MHDRDRGQASRLKRQQRADNRRADQQRHLAHASQSEPAHDDHRGDVDGRSHRVAAKAPRALRHHDDHRRRQAGKRRLQPRQRRVAHVQPGQQRRQTGRGQDEADTRHQQSGQAGPLVADGHRHLGGVGTWNQVGEAEQLEELIRRQPLPHPDGVLFEQGEVHDRPAEAHCAQPQEKPSEFSQVFSNPTWRRRGRGAAAGLLDDADAGAGADPRRSGRHHGLERGEVLDAAGGLHAHLGPDDATHQRDVGHGGAARAKAGGRLHEIRAGGLGQRGRGDLFLIGEQRRLDDHLAESRRRRGRAPTTASMSRSTRRRSPDLSAPMLITMSTSRAPSKIARRVS